MRFTSFVVASLALVVNARLDKGSLFGPFDALHQAIKPTMDNLPSHNVVSRRPVEVPQICKDHSGDFGVGDPSTGVTCNGLEAEEVQYDDCGQPWVVCRCQDANLSMDKLVELVGKVPPASRSYVRSFLATQAPGCSGVCFDGNFVRLNGECDMFVLMHEVGHALDDGYPDWPPFLDAVNGDSCVPDDYGNTNYVEEFAQMYAMVASGFFSGTIPADFTCLKKQFDTLWNDWRIQEALGAPGCLPDKKPAL
ncbi:hypothetical protein BKA62DRAFT_699791, partial [Auriculariales sp. MPI-PUGE-AT-0066]